MDNCTAELLYNEILKFKTQHRSNNFVHNSKIRVYLPHYSSICCFFSTVSCKRRNMYSICILNYEQNVYLFFLLGKLKPLVEVASDGSEPDTGSSEKKGNPHL